MRYLLAMIAASAGGLSAASAVLASLPLDFPLPIVLLQHLDPRRQSQLAAIMGRRIVLPVTQAADHQDLIAGAVYVAPPAFHTEILGGAIRLTSTERLHFVRPSADRLFTSAALTGRTIAVILTGSGHDGAAGALAVRAAGGVVIVQDEATSEHFGMPRAAIDAHAVDWVLPLERIGPAMDSLARM
jgi:two-component system chemotaxis response regulator CheB